MGRPCALAAPNALPTFGRKLFCDLMFRAAVWAFALAALLLGGGCAMFNQRPTAALPQTPPMTNAEVLTMAASGLSDEIIVQAIQTRPAAFDVSPLALIDLKTQGASDRVVQAMQMKAAAPPTIAVAQPMMLAPAPEPVIVPSFSFGIGTGGGHRHYRHRPSFHFGYSEYWRGPWGW